MYIYYIYIKDLKDSRINPNGTPMIINNTRSSTKASSRTLHTKHIRIADKLKDEILIIRRIEHIRTWRNRSAAGLVDISPKHIVERVEDEHTQE